METVLKTTSRCKAQTRRRTPKYDSRITETINAIEDCRNDHNLVELDMSSLEAFRNSILAE